VRAGIPPEAAASAAERRSGSFDGAPPAASVVVPTYDRAAFLPGLVAALEAQSVGPERFEVILVDNGSNDGTWKALEELARRTRLRLRAVRIEPNRGPAAARDLGARLARAPVICFTDDDCLPTPGWLEALLAGVAGGADVVQGRTEPDPTELGRAGPWDRTVWVRRATGLFETCNVAYRREPFLAAGGFAAAAGLVADADRRPFGEDAVVGHRVLAAGGRSGFAPEALVHHRMLPGTFAGWLREQRRLALFPALLRRVPTLRRSLWLGLFLGPRTAAVDLAAAAVVAAAAWRRPWPLAGVLPWIAVRWPAARRRRGRHPLVRLGQLAVGDALGLAALVAGSLRRRRLVL
jgi:GT2 family glycosyltransferase